MIYATKRKTKQGDSIVNNKFESLKSKKVVQRNTLVESPYSQEFTAAEIKLFEIAVADCKEPDMELFEHKKNKTYKFSNNELAKLLNTSSSNVSQAAEKIADNIMRKYISLKKVLADGSIEFEKIAIMPYAKYKDGIFEFDINFRMIPLCININQPYTEYYLHYLLEMSSSYAIKLYKLLYQYKKIGKRRFTVEELKNQFGIINKYSQYADLRKCILKPSVQQINEITNLHVEYTEIKFSRKIIEIEFIFGIKSSRSLAGPCSDNATEVSANLVKDEVPNSATAAQILGSIEPEISLATKHQLLKLYQDKGAEYIETSIVYARKNAKTNFDKYLSDTLSHGWAEVELKKNIQQKIKTTEKTQAIKQKQAKKDQTTAQVNLNKVIIDQEWQNLAVADQADYLSYASFILEKYSQKFSNFTRIREVLPLCIYAVSSGKCYDQILESYVKNFLGLALDISNYRRFSDDHLIPQDMLDFSS